MIEHNKRVSLPSGQQIRIDPVKMKAPKFSTARRKGRRNEDHIQERLATAIIALFIVFLCGFGAKLHFHDHGDRKIFFLSVVPQVEDDLYSDVPEEQGNGMGPIASNSASDQMNTIKYHPEEMEQRWSVKYDVIVEGNVAIRVNPPFQDKETRFLPFNQDLISDNMKSTDRLLYDINVIQLADEFGILDNELSAKELHIIFQKVVDIFAQANVYIRVDENELTQVKKKIGMKRSLAYLSYVDGPDLAEQVDLQQSSQLTKNSERSKYVAWYRSEMKKEFPVPSLELFIKNPKSGLASSGNSPAKEEVSNILLDWTIGYPLHISPWALVHTVKIFPLHLFGSSNIAAYSAGRIVVGTGSCDLRYHSPRKAFGESPVQCHGFEKDLLNRGQREKPIHFGEIESLKKRDVMVISRAIAHELGHAFGLPHPQSNCILIQSWESAPLMAHPENLRVPNTECTNAVFADHFKGVRLNEKEMQTIRNFVITSDVRQTRTVPGGKTVGDTTMMLGTQSAPRLFERFAKSQRFEFIGSGRRSLKKLSTCKLNQNLIVLTRLKSDVDGFVHRIRWQPGSIRSSKAYLYVMVVHPEVNPEFQDSVRFKIVDMVKEPIQLNQTVQKTHLEIDLPNPLRIRAGEMIALASKEKNTFSIDGRVYSSSKVKFPDVVGQFYNTQTSLIEPLLKVQPEYSTYPGKAIAPKIPNAFFFSDQIFDPRWDSFLARKPDPFRPSEWCTELIVNYDVVPVQ